MKTKEKLILFFFLSSTFLFGEAVPLQLDKNFAGVTELSDYSVHYVDPTAKISVEKIWETYQSGDFLSNDNFTLKERRDERARTNYWQVIKINNTSSDTLKPMILRANCYVTEVFRIENNSPVFYEKFGRSIRLKNSKSRYKSNRFSTTLNLIPDNNTYLIRIQSDFVKDKNLGIQLYDSVTFYEKFGQMMVWQYIIAGLFFGFFIFMVLYAIIQYFQTKEQSYLYYGFYALAVQFLYLRELDFTNLFFHSIPEWATSYQFYMYATLLIYGAYFQFIRVFLDTKNTMPLLHLFIKVFTAILIGYVCIEPFLRVFESDWLIFSRFKYGLQLSTLYVIALLLRQQTQLAKYILYGTISLIIGALLSMSSYFLLEENWIEYDTLPSIIAILIENLIFIAGLSYKSKLVTRGKEQEIQKLKQTEREKELKLQLSDLKTVFLTNITHEFRTPLTVILGMAEELKRNIKNGTATKLNLIQKNGNELLRLINQILNLTQISEGSMRLKKIQSDIVQFTSIHVESFSSYATSKKLGLQFYSEEEKIIMDFDPDKMRVILTNLLSNAFKFTPEYGKILVVLKLVETEVQRTLILSVKDTGKGIPAEELPFIFERYYQADNQLKEGAAGSGIGLTLIKELTKLMNGEVSVESEPNRKTIFKIQIPIENNAPFETSFSEPKIKTIDFSEPESNLSEQNFEDKSLNSTTDSKPHLLIIEDNPELVYYLKSCLNDRFKIITAVNGKEGIRTALEEVPDLIISDVMMPKADGYEVCSTLKSDERTSHIPIILLTAKASQNSKIEGLSKGADAYLTKPFNREELLIRVKKLIEIRTNLIKKYGNSNYSIPKVEITIEDTFLKKLNEILEEKHVEDTFDVSEFCKTIGLSRVQVHRKLKALTGKATGQYIRQFRLKKAMNLLKTTDLNVSEIAWKTGFSSPSWFNQSFKEEFGHPPSTIRK